jgi:hypothetical protein
MTEKKTTTKKNTSQATTSILPPEPAIQDIHGNPYELVHSRVKRFWYDHPDGSIITVMVDDDGTRLLARTEVRFDKDQVLPSGVGHAEEIRGSSNINKTSAVENAESSSVGRALGLSGYDASNNSIATAEEVTNAIEQQGNPQVPRKTVKKAPPSPTKAATPRSPGNPDGSYNVTQVEEVQITRKSDGAQFTKFVIHTGEGIKLETFNEGLRDKAQSALNTGSAIEADHEAESNYGSCKLLDITILEVAKDAPAAAPPVIDDSDIPF